MKTARACQCACVGAQFGFPLRVSVEYALAPEWRHGVRELPAPRSVTLRCQRVWDRRWLSRKPKLMGTLKLFIGEFLQASLDSFDGYESHLRLRFAFSLRYCS